MKHLKLNTKTTPFDLEGPLFQLKCAIDCVDAVHTAMVEGSCSPEAFFDALFGAINGLRDAFDEIEAQIYQKEESQ